MAALEKYNQKRNFEKTKEPKGALSGKGKKLRFVVQRHHASRLHYDFRLEMEGVLKSWAVPKGPSLDPKDKRLAVMVEDHPLSYRTFEGEIPKGNYGFGTVSIFDEGYYTALERGEGEQELLEALEKGSIKIVLQGKKLKGEFALVRIKNPQEDNAWLLIKHQDKYAMADGYNAEDEIPAAIKEQGKLFRKSQHGGSGRGGKRSADKPAATDKKSAETNDKEARGAIFEPMLAVLSENVNEDEEWIFEQKLDGFRTIAQVTDKTVKLTSRNGINFNSKFPSIVQALQQLGKSVILDGEVVAEDPKGQSNFQLLQHGEPLPAKFKLRYYIFDILMLDGNDLRDFPLSDRKDLLRRLFSKLSLANVLMVPELKEDLEHAMQRAHKKNWEGVIAKQADSRYVSGKRSALWRKLKLQQSQEAIIVGFTKPSGSRVGFGALVLAVQGEQGLVYIGNVGTGFPDDVLREMKHELDNDIVEKKPFSKDVAVANEKSVAWVKPKLIAEIVYSEWTADGHLRHPVFKALRDDKALADIKRVIPIKDIQNERELTFGRKKLKLSNQKKIYWPAEQITKGDLLDYYEQMGDFILPYLKDKPISMNRFPNGVEASSFFQKDVDKGTGPSWLKTVELESESTGNVVNYLLCNDLPTLLWIANMGSIEINPWLASYRKKTNPTFAVLDLDPNGADFAEVVAVANTAHDILEEAGVKNFVKTSGSTGLHIYIHVAGQYDFDVARDFVQMVAELVHEQHPQTTSLERSPTKRKNKIYLDYMQNKRAQTVVAPYSVRPKPGATVSTPLEWSEVNDELTIQQFTMQTVLERMASKPDPWKDIFQEKANLKKAIASF
ncbi:DNA ligase D [Sphingobacterium paludis]|uniref:DNA ligase (ATP) n=1 Tax=Sphingobacterium paludis TaxID=1476465 RepID=A0A4V3E0X5_9SPHI|nr:DNA ligase D [Sphingobacterium paludis]TDS09742.1 bifunctional non-homologous end joining protein LigD [Sphingobacterium paludis]